MDSEWKAALQRGDLVALGALITDAAHLDSRDEHGQTALMNAARAGNLDVVRLLTAHGADLNVAAKYGLTALMLAVLNDHREIARHLIMAGADVLLQGTGAPGFAGKTALDLARARQQQDVVALLESGLRLG